MSADKPRRLGRGLGALISNASSPNPPPESELQQIPLSRIRPNPFQPRQEFDPAELAELEASLKATGLLQPITVRRQGDGFELIAGERRFRAASNLGWVDITAIVRDFDNRTMLVLALVENLQRANLNPLEEARGYRRLVDDFQLTQQQIADAVGKDRTTITNLLRVLSLPAEIQALVESGALTTGHARALLALNNETAAIELARQAITGRYSVRDLEQKVRELMGPPAPGTGPSGQKPAGTGSGSKDPAVRRIQDDLRKYFQTDVKLSVSPGAKGKIEVAFYSNDDLDRILDLMLGANRKDF